MRLSSEAVISTVLSRLASIPAQECKRIFHGRGGCYNGWDGINIEKFGPVLVGVLYCPEQRGKLVSVLKALGQGYDGAEGLLLQDRSGPVVQLEWLAGEVTGLTASENSLYFGLRFHLQNPGLFLDMAPGREWVKAHAGGRHILNLFCYTGGFGLAALAGGACSVHNYDMSAGVIRQAKQNEALNPLLPAGKQRFFQHDIMKSLGKIGKNGPYDGIIIDPPVRQKSFNPLNHYNKLTGRVNDWCAPGGWVMFCLNDPMVPVQEFHRRIQSLLQADFCSGNVLARADYIEEKDADRGLKVLIFQRRNASAESP